MRKLWCVSQADFEEIMDQNGGSLPENSCAISIIGTPDVLRDYLEMPDTRHYFYNMPTVLNLEFDDITKDTGTRHGITAHGISDDQAKQIVEFLEKAVDEGLDIYVHCLAGRSRSQAIVRYVLSRWEGPWELNPYNPNETPNYYVLGKLRENERK